MYRVSRIVVSVLNEYWTAHKCAYGIYSFTWKLNHRKDQVYFTFRMHICLLRGEGTVWLSEKSIIRITRIRTPDLLHGSQTSWPLHYQALLVSVLKDSWIRAVELWECQYEQQANVKFCQKLSKPASETFQMITQVCGDKALIHSAVFKWLQWTTIQTTQCFISCYDLV